MTNWDEKIDLEVAALRAEMENLPKELLSDF